MNIKVEVYQNGRMLKWKNAKWKNAKMEDYQIGRLSKWKNVKMGDCQNGRLPKWKITKMEDCQNGRLPKWKIAKMVIVNMNLILNMLTGKWANFKLERMVSL